jgi:uncharacterized protein with beta-barrel porin domain
MNAKRNFIDPLVLSTAKSEHHAWQAIAHFGTGYDFVIPIGAIEPFGSVDWLYQFENAFQEQGAPAYNMGINDRTFSVLRGEIGARLYQQATGTWGTCVIRETFAYVNVQPFGLGTLNAFLIGVPGSFTQASYTQMENLFHGGFQLFIKQTCRGSLQPFYSLCYDLEIGQGYVSNNVQATIGTYF